MGSQTQSLIMKVAIVLFACVAVALAQQHPPAGNHHHNPMFELILNEVKALRTADTDLTSADCITKCDAVFGLDDPKDEAQNDAMCKNVCECEIDQNCQQHQHPTHPTHAPHGTHGPRPTRPTMAP